MSANPPNDTSSESGAASKRRVAIVVVSHSAKLAEGVAELAREVAGADVRIAAVGGLPLPGQPLGTDAEQVKRAIESVYSDDGVLVLLDLGSALLSAELAVDLLPAEWHPRVVLCDAPLVEGAVAAAVQARLGSPIDLVAAEARRALAPKSEHLNAVPGVALSDPAAALTEPGDETHTLRLVIRNHAGLHARPAARFVQTAGQFQADVRVRNLSRASGDVSARSIISLATLGVEQGHEILVTAEGPDAEATLAAIRALAMNDFEGDDFEDVPPGSGRVDKRSIAPRGDSLVLPPSPSGCPQGRESGAGVRPSPAPENPVASTKVSGPATLHGTAASPGVGIGNAYLYRPAAIAVSDQPVTDPEAEWRALTAALASTSDQIKSMLDATRQRGDATAAAIFEAHVLFLADEEILAPARHAILDRRINAARAWQETVAATEARFHALDDAYQRERARDVADLGARVLSNLVGETHDRLVVPAGAILVAADLTPADLAWLDPSSVAGLCTALGGPTSHTAILARSRGIPAVVGLGDAVLAIANATRMIVDGDDGTVVVDPDLTTWTRYGKRASIAKLPREVVRAEPARPTTTRDGKRISIMANVSSAADARDAVAAGAEGVGLFRTEFLFGSRQTLPGEDDQVTAYREVAKAMNGRTLTIRTLDAGADKPLPYLEMNVEANPYLGVRGIRLCLERPDVFKTQLRAIVTTAAQFPVRVMFPMIATLDEFGAAKQFLAEAIEDVRSRGQQVPSDLEVGTMVEVPSAALLAPCFAAEADFLSIGTNDLAQYTLAADRGNRHVATLADPLDPAVLRLIADVVDAARAHGKNVAVCGEMAGDPRAALLLIGLGVNELSMSPAAIQSVRDAIAAVTFTAAQDVATRALDARSAPEVRALLASSY